MERKFLPLPVKPVKSPAPKKVRYEHSNHDQSTTNEIISSLSVLKNTRSDNLKGTVKENLLKIEGLKKTVDYTCAEIKDVKGKVCDLEKR